MLVDETRRETGEVHCARRCRGHLIVGQAEREAITSQWPIGRRLACLAAQYALSKSSKIVIRIYRSTIIKFTQNLKVNTKCSTFHKRHLSS